jgi:hypothetical protein
MLLLLPNSEAITALFVGSFAVGLSVLYAVGKLYDLVSGALQATMETYTYNDRSFGSCYSR